MKIFRRINCFTFRCVKKYSPLVLIILLSTLSIAAIDKPKDFKITGFLEQQKSTNNEFSTTFSNDQVSDVNHDHLHYNSEVQPYTKVRENSPYYDTYMLLSMGRYRNTQESSNKNDYLTKRLEKRLSILELSAKLHCYINNELSKIVENPNLQNKEELNRVLLASNYLVEFLKNEPRALSSELIYQEQIEIFTNNISEIYPDLY